MTDMQQSPDVPSRKKRRLTFCDLLIALLFAGAIALSLWLAGVFGSSFRGTREARALISVNGTEYVYSLSEDRTIELTGVEGPAVLVIEDGTIRFTDSTCRDLTCVHMGKVGPGAAHFAACLPNNIIVTLEDGLTDAERSLTGEDDDALDW